MRYPLAHSEEKNVWFTIQLPFIPPCLSFSAIHSSFEIASDWPINHRQGPILVHLENTLDSVENLNDCDSFYSGMS